MPALLVNCCTTAALNIIITWHCAFSVFPRKTFVEKVAYMLKDMNLDIPVQDEILQDLNTKGWLLEDALRSERRLNTTSSLRKICLLDDVHTWPVRFSTTGVQRLSYPNLSYRWIRFSVTSSGDKHHNLENNCMYHYDIDAEPFNRVSLNSRYT
jgi:hypothetical protein